MTLLQALVKSPLLEATNFFTQWAAVIVHGLCSAHNVGAVLMSNENVDAYILIVNSFILHIIRL